MKYNNAIWLLIFTSFFLPACSRKDILPADVGEPVPYTPDATRRWQEIMNDAEFSLFKTAYQRSVVDSRVQATNAAFHTIFMPTNIALENAGWTADKINTATPEVLDSMLAYYIVIGRYTRENIEVPMPKSFPLNTLLIDPTLSGANTSTPYVYKLYVSTWEDSLMINGKTVAPLDRSEDALNGQVYKIDKFVSRPTLSLIEYIQSQPRFSMLLEAINASVPHYTYPADYNNPEWVARMTNVVQARPTLFLPTNAAFARSGFNTVEDIEKFIERSLPVAAPYYDENLFYRYPYTSMDSLLRPHGFSVLPGNSIYDNIYFYKDLIKNPAALTGFILQPGVPSQEGPITVETSFKVENNRVMVAGYLSRAAYQPIVEADIECLNGIIHVVDDFIMEP